MKDELPANPDEINRLIHEPARLMIISLLYVSESGDFTFLMRRTGLTWGNLSSHMSKLEDAGYIRVEKEFKGKRPNTMLSLTEAGQAAFRAYREKMQAMLDALPEIRHLPSGSLAVGLRVGRPPDSVAGVYSVPGWQGYLPPVAVGSDRNRCDIVRAAPRRNHHQ